MAEDKNNLKLDTLREKIRDSVKLFTEKLIEQLGDNLQSVTVVGSSLTEDFVSGKSDINTVVVLGKQDFNSLKIIAGMAKSMSKRKISVPLLMTPEYIERSRDVFGIELLSFQLTHETIFGQDLFDGLDFVKSDVRLQCERELKATLIRLRQGYIAAGANKRLVRDVLVSAASALVPLLQAMLWLKNIVRTREAESVFTKAADEFSVNVDSLVAARGWRHEKRRLEQSEIINVFESIYAAVERLSVIIDELEV